MIAQLLQAADVDKCAAAETVSPQMDEHIINGGCNAALPRYLPAARKCGRQDTFTTAESGNNLSYANRLHMSNEQKLMNSFCHSAQPSWENEERGTYFCRALRQLSRPPQPPTKAKTKSSYRLKKFQQQGGPLPLAGPAALWTEATGALITGSNTKPSSIEHDSTSTKIHQHQRPSNNVCYPYCNSSSQPQHHDNQHAQTARFCSYFRLPSNHDLRLHQYQERAEYERRVEAEAAAALEKMKHQRGQQNDSKGNRLYKYSVATGARLQNGCYKSMSNHRRRKSPLRTAERSSSKSMSSEEPIGDYVGWRCPRSSELKSAYYRGACGGDGSVRLSHNARTPGNGNRMTSQESSSPLCTTSTNPQLCNFNSFDRPQNTYYAIGCLGIHKEAYIPPITLNTVMSARGGGLGDANSSAVLLHALAQDAAAAVHEKRKMISRIPSMEVLSREIEEEAKRGLVELKEEADKQGHERGIYEDNESDDSSDTQAQLSKTENDQLQSNSTKHCQQSASLRSSFSARPSTASRYRTSGGSQGCTVQTTPQHGALRSVDYVQQELGHFYRSHTPGSVLRFFSTSHQQKCVSDTGAETLRGAGEGRQGRAESRGPCQGSAAPSRCVSALSSSAASKLHHMRSRSRNQRHRCQCHPRNTSENFLILEGSARRALTPAEDDVVSAMAAQDADIVSQTRYSVATNNKYKN